MEVDVVGVRVIEHAADGSKAHARRRLWGGSTATCVHAPDQAAAVRSP